MMRCPQPIRTAAVLLCLALGNAALADCTVRYVPLAKELQVQHRVGYVEVLGTDTGTAAETHTPQIKAMAAQLEAAQWLFASIFGVDAPMSMPRYRQVDRVEALLVPMKMAGIAYDETVHATTGHEPAVCVLRIKIADHLRPRNVTPAHELFHLFQYGLTMFKRPWLMEGTARWAESAFLASSPPERTLPQTADELQTFMQSSYSAGPVWSRLTRLLDPAGLLDPPASIASLRYSDGSAVLASRRLHGSAFMGELFRALGEADQAMAKKAGFSPHQWTENEQRSPAHDAVIWQVLQRVAASHAARGAASPELERFLGITLAKTDQNAAPAATRQPSQ